MVQHVATPYCGAPPLPDQLWSRWNLDPILIAAALLALSLYEVGARRAGLTRGRRIAFYCGWGATLSALVSPLCPLSVALFSARVAQHMFLTIVAAPLVVLGAPGEALASLRYRAQSRAAGRPDAIMAAGAYALALWCWHAQQPYAATFNSDVAYWLMHASLYGAALWFWSGILNADGRQFARSVAAIAFTAMQMSVLSAIITFAPRPIYTPHFATTWPWGLSPLEDQQLGGAIMWAPSGIVLAGGLAVIFAILMRRAEARAQPSI